MPLQVAWPGMIRGGQRLPGDVSLVDVTATILDMADVLTERRQFMEMDGESLLPLLRGETMLWKAEAFSWHLAHGTDGLRTIIRRGQM